MEPISTALTGIALVQQGVEFVKSNIATAQDIGQIFGMVDRALDGNNKSKKLGLETSLFSVSTKELQTR